jgi:ribose 5-phosphate isomerase B
MKIAIGSDHAGYDLKESVKAGLKEEGYDVVDYGPAEKKSVDYPDYAELVARAVVSRKADRGVLVCGTGIGISIAANKINGARAARVSTIDDARLTREHNDANIITFGGRIVAPALALEMTKTFLETPFLKGRHLRRVNKIKALEKRGG